MLVKSIFAAIICGFAITGCASRPWTAQDQAQWQKNWGTNECGGMWKCYNVPWEARIEAPVVLEKE